MDSATIGIQVHSGWGALVAVASDGKALTVLHRARLEVTSNDIPGCKQPYHHAEKLDLPEAKRHLANCAETSSRLAVKALSGVAEELRAAKKRLTGSAILLGSGRALPDLASILNAHPLIHTAEGELFRRIFWEACCRLEIRPAGFRSRDLGDCVASVLGKATKTRLERSIQTLGKTIGPPWTADQKIAALAAALVLLGDNRKINACSQEPATMALS
jgi:hypothetical protein